MKGFTVIAVCLICACVNSLGQNLQVPFNKYLPNHSLKTEKFVIQKPMMKGITSSPIIPNIKSEVKLPKGTFMIQEVIINDTCKNIYKYDDKLNDIENRSEILQNGKWLTIAHVTKTYDSDSHLILALGESFQNNGWVNYKLDKLSYDQKGNFIKEQNYYWINNSWSLIVTDSMSYDEQNRLLYEIVLNFNKNGEVDREYILKYTYDKNGNQLSKINEGWINGVKEYYLNEFSTYDNFDNKITYLYEESNPKGNFNKYKCLYNYDTNKKMIDARTESWNNNGWSLVYINNYFYDNAGNRYLIITNYYANDTLNRTWKEIKTFDERKNCLTVSIQSFVDSIWTTTQKTTYAYNTLNKKSMELGEFLSFNGWIKSYQFLYEFDGKGNLLSENYRYLVNLEKENGYTYQYKYNENGCLTYADYFEWKAGSKYPESGMLQMTLYNQALNQYYYCHSLSANYNFITASNSIQHLPIAFSLEQNYPNPFNPSTNINYSIPEYSKVVLKIYDITGKELCTLVNKVQPSGNYSIDFNGAGLASGIYFYRLFNKNNILTKKMMLLR